MNGALERRTAVGDQVVAGVSLASRQRRFDVVSRGLAVKPRRATGRLRAGSRLRASGHRHATGRLRAGGHGHGLPSNLDLGQARTARQLFDRMPVAVSSGEVHVSELTARTQNLVDKADTLDELGPVEPRDEAHARDHVADRHVDRRLELVLEADNLLGRGPLARE